jgi:hypothetical protein
MEASQNEQLELRTLTERVTDEIDAVYGRHGYLIEGEPNRRAVEDKVYDLVATAVVDKRADRGKLAVSRRNLVKAAFPQVPGPEAWAEADDPELAEGVYKRLDSYIWRLVDDNAGGKIQSRLNSDIGLILCRTKATPDKADAVYVTSDLQCLLQDFTKPQKERISKEALRFATNLAMAVDRRPEHAAQFKRELNSAMKAALGTGNAILVPAIEAATADTDDDVDDDE